MEKERLTLHIFNPEHDIALASNLSNFTAPHAGRQLRHDLGFLPALWADDGDAVLVDDVEQARQSYQKAVRDLRRKTSNGRLKDIQWMARRVPVERSKTSSGILHDIQPWGWDKALCAQLKRSGVGEHLLPSADDLEAIRQLSHRRVASQLLPQLQREGTVGESFECRSAEAIDDLLQHYGSLVLKAPWSSSGRGLRFLDAGHTPLSMQAGWVRNMLERQGSIMAEPCYNKVKDFGMEFRCEPDGTIRYLGLSLFHTANGAYTGNILATEAAKQSWLSTYLPEELTHSIQSDICRLLAPVLKDKYQGPFGVDMMIVSRGGRKDNRGEETGFLLHPCVEINLRRTMGHVALSLSPTDDDIQAVMRIDYAADNYRLHIIR